MQRQERDERAIPHKREMKSPHRLPVVRVPTKEGEAGRRICFAGQAGVGTELRLAGHRAASFPEKA